MAITVRFFAALRERVGQDLLSIDIGSEQDLGGLLALLHEQLGDTGLAALTAPEIRIAINHEFVTGHWTVHDGDEVAFMPPITGG